MKQYFLEDVDRMIPHFGYAKSMQARANKTYHLVNIIMNSGVGYSDESTVVCMRNIFSVSTT